SPEPDSIENHLCTRRNNNWQNTNSFQFQHLPIWVQIIAGSISADHRSSQFEPEKRLGKRVSYERS
ncbi:hypothetical protein, partial [Ochrobactrum sp. SFR4]|uniref:hypothetical protein n=1 Tax=Ochrobactrum sp. SFR4 TaxID=2717368 RepID=UPI001C8CEC43